MTTQQVQTIMQALSHPHRLRILEWIRARKYEPFMRHDLQEAMPDLLPYKVYDSLRALVNAELLRMERMPSNGAPAMYTPVNAPVCDVVLGWIDVSF